MTSALVPCLKGLLQIIARTCLKDIEGIKASPSGLMHPRVDGLSGLSVQAHPKMMSGKVEESSYHTFGFLFIVVDNRPRLFV